MTNSANCIYNSGNKHWKSIKISGGIKHEGYI